MRFRPIRLLRAVAILSSLTAALALCPSALAAFPGVNGKIAFVSNRGGPGQIYAMNGDGTGQINLTTAGGIQPAVSADGQRIAFTTVRDGNAEIYVMDADGTDQVNLNEQPGGGQRARVSAHGQRIAFTRAPYWNGDSDIYAMNADGTGVPEQLTNREGSTTSLRSRPMAG